MNVLYDFSEELISADVGFLYYAGHGIEIGSRNYLVPTSVDFNKYKDPKKRTNYIKTASYDIEDVMNHLYYEQKDKLNIVVLDACRISVGNARGTKKEPQISDDKVTVNSGTLLAFSTRSGEVAEDGIGNNSAYCESLSRQILIPNQTLGQIFGNVREDVESSTENRQKPIVRSALSGYAAKNFIFIEEKDASIIKVADLLNSAHNNEVNGYLLDAIDDYTMVRIFLDKLNIDEFDINTLIDVYINMGNIYVKLQGTEPTKYNHL